MVMDKERWAAILNKKQEEQKPKERQAEVEKSEEVPISHSRNSANKPVEEWDIPELNAALDFINGKGSKPEPGQFEQISNKKSKKTVTVIEDATLESVSITPDGLEPVIRPTRTSTMTEVNRPPRVASTRYEPSTEVLQILESMYGLRAQIGASRVSFWKDGKRQFIIESGKVEWKAFDRPRTPISSDEELIDYLRGYHGDSVNLVEHSISMDSDVATDLERDVKNGLSNGDVSGDSDSISGSIISGDTKLDIREGYDTSPKLIAAVVDDTNRTSVDKVCSLASKEEPVIKRTPRLAKVDPYYPSPPNPDEPPIETKRAIDPDKAEGAELLKEKKPHRILDMDWVPQPRYEQGIMTFDRADEAYVYIMKDFLDNAPITTRKHTYYKGFKPYAVRVTNTDIPYILLPGSNWADTWDWFLAEIFDCIMGEEVIGGHALRYDKHRRVRYPRASGAHDWGFKMAMGVEGDNLLEWLRRSVRLDPTTRQAVASPWNNNRDLKKRTKREELEIHRKEEYQRLPCPITIQYTKSEDDKGLNCMVHQRAMDFDGAFASDVYRFAEFGHIISTGGYPKGYSGSMTFMMGSAIVESKGASDFIRHGNLLEWYSKDKQIWEIPYAYETTRQCSKHIEPNAPTQKAYDWFENQKQQLGVVYHNWIKCQWGLGMERLEKIQYAYYRDMGYAMAAFEWMLSECMADEVKRVYADAPKTQEHLALPDKLSEYPPFYFLKKVRGFWQYMCAVEIARHLLNMGDLDKLEELFTLTPQTRRFRQYITVDACIILYAKYRKAAKEFGTPQLKADIEFYERLCET